MTPEERRELHHQHELEVSREYHRTHRKEESAYRRERYANDPEYRERKLESNRRWRESLTDDQREQLRQYKREYFLAHKAELTFKRNKRLLERLKAERSRDGDES